LSNRVNVLEIEGMLDLDFGTLASSLIIGMIGAGVFMYGKSMRDMRWLGVGAVLTVFPYFVGSVILMWAITGAILGGLWWAARGTSA
jgi:hypothetical protein